MRSSRWYGFTTTILGIGAIALARFSTGGSAFDPAFNPSSSWFGSELEIGSGSDTARIITSIPASMAMNAVVTLPSPAPAPAPSPAPSISPRPAGEPETAYFMVVFSSEDRHSNHSFATFLKVKSHDSSFERVEYVRSNTLSWLPADGTVNPSGVAEKGRNYALRETLHEARLRGSVVKALGPYRITERLYNKAMTQIRRLESRSVKFLGRETDDRKIGTAVHGVHALTDLDTANGLAPIGNVTGEKASRLVLLHFIGDLIDPNRTFAPLLRTLGVEEFRIEKRALTAEELRRKR